MCVWPICSGTWMAFRVEVLWRERWKFVSQNIIKVVFNFNQLITSEVQEKFSVHGCQKILTSEFFTISISFKLYTFFYNFINSNYKNKIVWWYITYLLTGFLLYCNSLLTGLQNYEHETNITYSHEYNKHHRLYLFIYGYSSIALLKLIFNNIENEINYFYFCEFS